MRSVTTSAGQQFCYFSIVPGSGAGLSAPCDTDDTPACSPLLTGTPSSPIDAPHPLLAFAAPSPSLSTAAAASLLPSLMQRQTTAAHCAPSRPRIQDVLHVTSDESSSSGKSNSSSSIDSVSSIDNARCSRCQRTPSLDLKTGKSNMIQYGLNLWYCNRCAGMVGFPHR